MANAWFRNFCVAAMLVVSGGVASGQSRDITKSADALKAAFAPIAAAAAESTVQVKCYSSTVGLGTVIDSRGYIVTKASLLTDHITVKLHDGKDYEATIVENRKDLDIACLKIEATGLKAVSLAEPKVDVGEWVAATGLPGQPVLAVGIVSTPRRKIIAKPGFLGVALADPPAADNPDEAPKGVLIKEVTKGSAAEAAGLLKDDIILRINGKEAADRSALSDMIHSYEPNTDIMLTISRAGKEREMKATLGSMTEPVTPLSPEAQAEAILKGSISARASNFPAVIQHDTVIFPKQCGGPLVDLNGNFLGINIARAGRTESYAIPADLIKPILAKVTAGPATQPGREISAPAQK